MSRFTPGQKVLTIFHGLQGHRETAEAVVDSIENGVLYLQGESHREEGITYDPETGHELENFFAPMRSEITELPEEP